MTSPDSPQPPENAPTEPTPASSPSSSSSSSSSSSLSSSSLSLSSSSSSSSSSSAPLSTQRLVMAGAGVALVLTVATVALLRPPALSDAVQDSPSTPASSDRSWKEKQPFVPNSPAPVGMFVDVVRPTALRPVLTENAWLKATATEPLGRGFLGGWAGLLGSPGEELGLQKLTQGVIGELVVDAILVQPVRLAFFAGGGGPAPALVIPAPSAALSTTYAAIVAAVERGGLTIEGCPGDPPAPTETPPPAPADAAVGVDAGTPAAVAPKNQLAISRLVIADQPVFATLARDRLVLSREPQSVVNALCGEVPNIAAVPGADVVMGVSPDRLGRDAQAFAGVLGLAGSPLLAFKVEGTSLRPVGLSAAVNKPDRLASEAVAAALWGFVPEDLPVAAAVNLRLPQTLSAKSLQAMYAGERPTLSTRQVLVLWQPHGESGHNTEVAVVWSEAADREGLEQLFSGPNALTVRMVCERPVASSSAALLSRIEAACTKRSPSLSFAAPAVVQGLQTKTSVGLVVDLGRLLSTLLHEGFMSDPAVTQKKGELPVEIEAAKKRLLELPRFGLFGDVQGDTLVPRGFSS